jgi:anti-sigma-K factor RskA
MGEQSEIIDYLIGELDELDRARFERRMQESADVRAEVERLRPLLERLGGLSEPAWEHAVFGAKAEHARRPTRLARLARRPAWRRSPRPVAVGLAGAAALTVALILALTGGSSSTPSHTVVLSALVGAPQGSHATATITDSERLQIKIDHLRPTDAAHYYELWLMTDSTHLVSVASFRVDSHGSARLSLPLPASPAAYRYLNISLQRAGRSGISRDSILRGPTASLQ